jgi:hypothetical protein
MVVQDDGDIENPYLHWYLNWLHLFFFQFAVELATLLNNTQIE